MILSAGHTRTSIMRLSIGGGHFVEPEIILPETRAMFERQADRKKKALAGNGFNNIFVLIVLKPLSVL